jgi:DNA-binding protein YbaB
MTDPMAALRTLEATLRDLDEQVGELAEGTYVAADEAGIVRVTLNGHGRMLDLRLDHRLLSMGAQETARRINDVLAAANDLIEDTYAGALPELQARSEQAVADLQADLQDQTRRLSEYADGDSAS